MGNAHHPYGDGLPNNGTGVHGAHRHDEKFVGRCIFQVGQLGTANTKHVHSDTIPIFPCERLAMHTNDAWNRLPNCLHELHQLRLGRRWHSNGITAFIGLLFSDTLAANANWQ